MREDLARRARGFKDAKLSETIRCSAKRRSASVSNRCKIVAKELADWISGRRSLFGGHNGAILTLSHFNFDREEEKAGNCLSNVGIGFSVENKSDSFEKASGGDWRARTPITGFARAVFHANEVTSESFRCQFVGFRVAKFEQMFSTRLQKEARLG